MYISSSFNHYTAYQFLSMSNACYNLLLFFDYYFFNLDLWAVFSLHLSKGLWEL